MDPGFGPVHQVRGTVDWGAHPPQFLGVGAHSGFQVCVPMPLIKVHAHPGALGLCTHAAEPLIWMPTDPQLWACLPMAAWPLIRLWAHPGFQLWGSRPLSGVRAHWGTLGLCAQAAGLFIRVCTHPGFQLWAPRPLIWVHTNPASGVCWGCLSQVHSPGNEGVRTQEATAAEESFLTGH